MNPASPFRSSILGGIHQPVRLDPRHHSAQLLTHFFNRMFPANPAISPQYRSARLIFQNEFPGKLTGLNLLENLAHLGLGLLGDNPRAAREITIFSSIRDRVTHIGNAALVD